jgi:hypothetical protein
MVALRPNRPVVYAVAPEHALGARLLVRETGPAEAPKPRRVGVPYNSRMERTSFARRSSVRSALWDDV